MHTSVCINQPHSFCRNWPKCARNKIFHHYLQDYLLSGKNQSSNLWWLRHVFKVQSDGWIHMIWLAQCHMISNRPSCKTVNFNLHDASCRDGMQAIIAIINISKYHCMLVWGMHLCENVAMLWNVLSLMFVYFVSQFFPSNHTCIWAIFIHWTDLLANFRHFVHNLLIIHIVVELSIFLMSAASTRATN